MYKDTHIKKIALKKWKVFIIWIFLYILVKDEKKNEVPEEFRSEHVCYASKCQ